MLTHHKFVYKLFNITLTGSSATVGRGENKIQAPTHCLSIPMISIEYPLNLLIPIYVL
jgi:hypothetical protein